MSETAVSLSNLTSDLNRDLTKPYYLCSAADESQNKCCCDCAGVKRTICFSFEQHWSANYFSI